MRTTTNLLSFDGRVYVYLASEALAMRFLKDAEAEGFTFKDGVKPTERGTADIYALNPDLTVSYVNFVGHVAFGCGDSIGGEKLIRIDYGRYVSGRDAYYTLNAAGYNRE